MQTKVIEIVKTKAAVEEVQTIFSLKPFIKFIEQKVANKKQEVKTFLFEYILNKVKENPALQESIDLKNIHQYRDVLEFIYLTLVPPAIDETQSYWALGVPLLPVIFYGTDAFYQFLLDENNVVRGAIQNNVDNDEKDHQRLSMIYSLALERLYNFPTSTNAEVIQIIPDEKTKLKRAYRIHFDTRFIDLTYTGEKLPDINLAEIHIHDNLIDYNILQNLKQIIPLKSLRIEGFNIVSIADITPYQAIENIKNIIVNLTPQQMIYDDVIESLKNLIGIPNLYMRITPMLKVNNKLVINGFEKLNIKMQEMCDKYGITGNEYTDALENFSQNPAYILKKDLNKNESNDSRMFVLLNKFGVQSAALIPVFFQKNLVGVVEIYAKEKDQITEQAIASLEPAIPLLEQLLQTNIDDFNIMIDNVVKDKFTSLQPSVEWRFNEAAWNYLQNKKQRNRVGMETILFENVYPLYGAIDVRNSTIERNIALQSDLKTLLNLLINLIKKLDKIHHLELIDEMTFKAMQFLQQITEHFTGDEEYQINRFMDEEIVSFLLHFQQSYPDAKQLISDYYLSVSPAGTAFEHRTALEKSLQTINIAISNLLDQMNIEIQNAYPCFFEKFRTDGVEYDIYIGQSITPDKEFHPMYLKNLRLWQLTSMAMIAKLAKALIPELSKPLETTQLIFVHANPIDISFRNDERRFDVEGAYNIRYEIVKKRIDKVHIKNSEERLTQPDKIALVYFQQKDIEDYFSYITYLQQQDILNNDLEYLELEELQGINGLKAIRIGVNMNAETAAVPEFQHILNKVE